MCFGLGGSKARAPDPYATAQMQNSINQEALRYAANLNQIGENTPFGRRYYTGSNDDGTRTENIEYDPRIQSILDQDINTSARLSALAGSRASGIPSTDFSLNGMPDVRRAGGVQFMESLPTPSAFGDFGRARRDIADVGQQQRSVDLSGVQQIAGLGDFGGERERVEDALFQRGSRRVNEQFGRDQQALQSQLAAQGIPQGSAAYDREMTRLMQNRDDALATATEGSIINAGQEQGRLFGQSLQARQQGVGEQFSLADLFNAAQNTDFGQEASRARFYNEGQQQDFAQDFSRVMADRDWNSENANFINDARERQFGAGLQLQDSDMNFRNNAINENVLARNQNLNELAALFSGQPIQSGSSLPQFGARAQYNPAQGSPDAVGTANNNYTQQQQARAAILGSIFGSLGQVGAAGARYCWVAREVYGVEDGKWLRFRQWLFTEAPRWFMRLYVKRGERFAAFISDKPRIKALIRKWMDARIA